MSDTAKALDEAARAHLATGLEPGDIVTSWMLVAATRGAEGGGVVMTEVSDEDMPQWEARGLLTTALRMVDRSEDEDQREA